ncbi:hypothetical protein [Peribacillus sp. TH27]|uniref:hypothetical protein n=1 Tax=Peribacillus sp. TH27 TaxID=2798484 RepID=UPI0019128246|nr:hypothetical protein [Peribacillus sp. TH27]MBK5463519.1 hypothetical protein [Peribacillus sp. TH27]
MIVEGDIYRKRDYIDYDPFFNYIIFLELKVNIEINGDNIKILPVICNRSRIRYKVGDSIKLQGRLLFKKISTSMGTRCVSPVPVFKLKE